jgi:hypothetical protein
VADDTDVLELFEIPVDRGEVHIGCLLLNRLGQRLGAHVSFRAEQDLEQEAP